MESEASKKPLRGRHGSQSGLPLQARAWRQIEYRAAPPRLPELTPAMKRRREAYEIYRREREKIERRSVVRGLLLLALLALSISIFRSGLDRVFVHGWWRP
jgi:hypothetical protein